MPCGLSHKQLSGYGVTASAYATNLAEGGDWVGYVLCDRFVTISADHRVRLEAAKLLKRK